VETEQLKAIEKIKDWSSKEFGLTMERNATGKIKSTPIDGKKYQLYYWDQKWIYSGASAASRKKAVFYNVPANALYRIMSEDADGKERVFTYEQGKQIWW
jgi:hypothetical protein